MSYLIFNEKNILDKIIELNKELNKPEYDYGIVVNGKKHCDDDYVDNNLYKYRTLSPDQFMKYKCGVCWDFTNYQAWYFKKYFKNVEFKLLFMICQDDDDDVIYDPQLTHTFMVFKYNNKWYKFESAWTSNQGVILEKSLDNILSQYINLISKLSPRKYIKIYEFTPVTKYNQTIREFMNHCLKGTLIKKKIL